ncbi:MAG: bifunctional diaminohydroxyphosphoribosylaminopyrimidine deaminase/5-amino-6-(5-phosphoribosylamino)uracil reductase RibD [Acidimicrobiia bacterium]|nr:bifunctional diaminohydroxyphosphoribosylaminopyrimidine deaminase/5-amino-6-(5-phosphoribosylamino)uracil reductase RibD [Acidimicrobiia bacterium]
MATDGDLVRMQRAMANAARSRLITSPNPWVGAVVVSQFGEVFDGATEIYGGRHAEVVALDAAGDEAEGAIVYTTLEPCRHTGRTGPCTKALIDAEVARVVVGVLDPDPNVAGQGVTDLRAAGIEVEVGVGAEAVAEQLAPYLHHRRTGRPWVVVKLATTIDGRLAAPDGTSTWITGPEARADVHRLRAESDSICVGAATVRLDDPSLTVRDYRPDIDVPADRLHPRRVVLGAAAEDARVQPADSFVGDLDDLLAQLGADGVLQLLVEGGADVAGSFHRAGLVNRYVLYVAPAALGGDDGVPVFAGAGAATMSDIWRGSFIDVTRMGDDVRLVVGPNA